MQANSIISEKKVIQVKQLNKSFGSNHVLRELSFDLKQGENLAVLGKSGSGKSVLIKCLIGLMMPETGEVDILGNDVMKLTREQMDALRTDVGFLFQSNALYDSMTVRENLEFPLRRHRKDLEQNSADELVNEVLMNVGLEQTIDMMPSELSGGMRKRIALARTLILKPNIIFYDEPTTGLDPITSREISNLILDIQKKYHTSSIIISHDMSCIKIVANRILMLIDGTCYAQGTYDELANSTDSKIKQFFI